MSIHKNFRAKIFRKPLFRFIPRLSILPEFDLTKNDRSLVLDPIGNQPFLLSSLLSQGENIISTPVNPVERLILECIFEPPSTDLPLAILNKFYDTRFGDQRLEQHLRGLFQTQCDNCGKDVAARYFVRDGSSGELKSRSYACNCGNSGVFAATERDQSSDAVWRRSDGLYRSRVAQTFVGVANVTTDDVMEVLSVYSPRALYALDVILQKIGPLIADQNEKYFQLLLLYIADSVSGLWNIKDPGEPPKLIYKAKNVMEFNIWASIEEGINVLGDLASEAQQTHEHQNQITLSNMQELREGKYEISSVVAVVPRPNQAYWGLCALWSRWLLNLPIDHPFLKIIERKKVDWDWFYDASVNLLKRIAGVVDKEVSIHFVLLEKEPDYTASFIFAVNNTGYKLDFYSLDRSTNTLILNCRIDKPLNEFSAEGIKRSKLQYLAGFVRDLLAQRNEPVPYEVLLVDVLCAFSQDRTYYFQKRQYKAFIQNLNNVLMTGAFEDIEKRSAPETGTWKIGGSGAQGRLL